MNAWLLFLLDKPGLLAVGLPVLLSAALYAICVFQAARRTALFDQKLRALEEMTPKDGVWPPPPRREGGG